MNRGPKRRSTVIVLWLERPGRVVFTVLDVDAGCRPLGTFAHRGRAGVNRVRYRGRLGGKPLPPGRYTLVPRVYADGRATELERVTIQILRPGAKVPLWRRNALVRTDCRLAATSASAAAFARFTGSNAAFAREGSGSPAAAGAGAAGGAEGEPAGGVAGAEATNPQGDAAEPTPVDEDSGDAGEGLALPAPFDVDGDGPPPLVAAAVLAGLGFAIMALIVLLVRYVRGSWNP